LRRPVESAQYTSFAFGRHLTASELIASMGTVGDALDNAVAESFFATLECELLDRDPWPTRAGLRTAIRLHRGLLQPPTPPLDPRLRHPSHLRAAAPISSTRGLTTVSTKAGQLQIGNTRQIGSTPNRCLLASM
jgi:hypothetical protein